MITKITLDINDIQDAIYHYLKVKKGLIVYQGHFDLQPHEKEKKKIVISYQCEVGDVEVPKTREDDR